MDKEIMNKKLDAFLRDHLEASVPRIQKLLYDLAVTDDPLFKMCDREIFNRVVHVAFFSGGLKIMADMIVDGHHLFEDPQIEDAILDSLTEDDEEN